MPDRNDNLPIPTRQRQLTAALAVTVLPMFAGDVTTQQFTVVPAAATNTDAISRGWIAGASDDVRQQTLIGASHLQALIGSDITAIELRRDASAQHSDGGAADLTVTLSISPHGPTACAAQFQANVGSAPVQVFSGQVALPGGASALSSASWNPDNIVRIDFTTPFHYSGGTLCVDVIGHTLAGAVVEWWPADLASEKLGGTAVDLGGGCGSFGGASSRWAAAETGTLVPGGDATFFAYGTPGGLALAAFGTSAAAPMPLAWTGLPSAPGCELWLQTIDALEPAMFVPGSEPLLQARGGEAVVRIRIPNHPNLFGYAATTQWIDVTQMATSNAIAWHVANTAPSLDLARIEGHPNDPRGITSPCSGHVMRFEHN